MLILHLWRLWDTWLLVFGMALSTISRIIWLRVCLSEFKRWSRQKEDLLDFRLRFGRIYSLLHPTKILLHQAIWWWSNSNCCCCPSGLISWWDRKFRPIIVWYWQLDYRGEVAAISTSEFYPLLLQLNLTPWQMYCKTLGMIKSDFSLSCLISGLCR